MDVLFVYKHFLHLFVYKHFPHLNVSELLLLHAGRGIFGKRKAGDEDGILLHDPIINTEERFIQIMQQLRLYGGQTMHNNCQENYFHEVFPVLFKF